MNILSAVFNMSRAVRQTHVSKIIDTYFCSFFVLADLKTRYGNCNTFKILPVDFRMMSD
jgi:hypothetical protein